MRIPSRPGRFGAAGLSLALLLILLTPSVALAHAELEETTPADGATIEGTPTEIVAIFSEDLEDASSLSLRDAAGAEVAKGGRDPEDHTRLVITDLPVLAAGAYEVRWTASSDDGHLERDTWSFTVVAPPTPSPTPPPTATPAPAATPGPTGTPTLEPTVAPSASAAPAPDDEVAASGGEVLIPIVVGLAIVAVAGGWLLSRRDRA